MALEDPDHLLERRRLAVDQVVGEDHRERRIPHHRLRAQHGVTEPQRVRLAHVGAAHAARKHVAHDLQQVVAAALGIWLNQLTFVYSVRLTTAATVALMFGTLPIFVALVAQAFGLERLHLRHWLATVVSFSGVALVAAGSTGGLGGDLGGILLALGASVTWAAYSVAMGPLMQRYSPYRISAFMLLVGSVPLLLSAVRQLAEQDWAALSGLAWACFLYSLFFSLVFTNVMWFTAIDRVGAARASLYANLQPFLGAFFALVVLSEEMTALQFLGGLVIGAGILLARQARPPAPSPD